MLRFLAVEPRPIEQSAGFKIGRNPTRPGVLRVVFRVGKSDPEPFATERRERRQLERLAATLDPPAALEELEERQRSIDRRRRPPTRDQAKRPDRDHDVTSRHNRMENPKGRGIEAPGHGAGFDPRSETRSRPAAASGPGRPGKSGENSEFVFRQERFSGDGEVFCPPWTKNRKT
jgi:hypothetical protein